MRILVTGGIGFIGGRVVERLLNSGNKIVVMDRRTQVFPEVIQDKIENVAGDIRAFSDIMRVIHDFKIDRIIHVAYALTTESEADPLAAIQINVLGTCNIFEAARICEIERVVFCSSMAAYGPQECYGDRPVKEDEILMKPVFIYGATKVLNEFMASRFEKKFGLEIPVLRIAAVYGKGREERGLTAWASHLVSNVVRGKPAFINLRPDQLSSFIYVDDVVEQLTRLCLAETLNYRIYNSGGFTSTPREFSEIIKKYYPDSNIKFDENAAPWFYPYKMDGTRIANEFNWEIRDPEAGLLDQINQERFSLGLEPLKRKV
jgi:nucleoside-diphosphate-sugar epimerase